jgi:hypothetical protein
MGGCVTAHKSMRTHTSFRPGQSLSLSQVASISPRGTTAYIPARFETIKPLLLRVLHCGIHKNCRCLPCDLFSSSQKSTTRTEKSPFFWGVGVGGMSTILARLTFTCSGSKPPRITPRDNAPPPPPNR